jgi:homeobox-leucine zipper protein
MEIEDRTMVHPLYRDLIISGMAFGARRWLATLQRTCERFACLAAFASSPRDIGGGGYSYFQKL